MPEDSLGGLRIPSLSDIVERALEHMGTRIIDLANPLQRRQLINFIENALGHEFQFELQAAVEAATQRAVKHVFQVMRDADYQDKKRQRQAQSRKARAARREKKEAAEREARMDYSRRHLEVSKRTIQ